MIRWITSLCLCFLAVALGASDPPRQAPSLVSRASVARLAPPQAPPVKSGGNPLSTCPCGPGCPCCEGPNCTCRKPVSTQAPGYSATIILSRTMDAGTVGGPFIGIQATTTAPIPPGAYKATLTPLTGQVERGFPPDATIYRDPISGRRWHYIPGGSWEWLPEVREEVPVPPQPLFHTFAPMPMMRGAVRGGGC